MAMPAAEFKQPPFLFHVPRGVHLLLFQIYHLVGVEIPMYITNATHVNLTFPHASNPHAAARLRPLIAKHGSSSHQEEDLHSYPADFVALMEWTHDYRHFTSCQ